MTSSNRNLHAARKAKNDEFYTRREDIERELPHYARHFRDRVVYCNCDGRESEFVRHFDRNYGKLGLAGLFHSSEDFRGEYSTGLLEQADIVVTNPPFSLFREYVAQLVRHRKKFIIVGPINAIAHREIFPLIKDNRMWLGTQHVNWFDAPGNRKATSPSCWFTNLAHGKSNDEIVLTETYNPKDYPKYDNYNAIEVGRTRDIPRSYRGVMGVPISFLFKYSPKQFEIVGMDRSLMHETTGKASRFFIGGKEQYARIAIRHRKIGENE